MAEISEALAAKAGGRIECKEWIQHFGNFAQRDFVGDWGIEPGALEVAADEQGEKPGHAADDANIAGIGPCTTVRATGDADAEPLALEAVTPQPGLDRGDEVVANAFGFGERQAAGWQGRAGQRPARGRQQVLGEADAVPAQQTLDRVA